METCLHQTPGAFVFCKDPPDKETGCDYISRVSDQNGVSLLYIMIEIHHSGQEPSI